MLSLKHLVTFFVVIFVFFSHNLYSQSPPTLLTPENNSTCVPLNFEFTWTDVSAAYRIEISLNSDMSNPFISDVTGSETKYTASFTNYNTTYYWQVTAVYPGVPPTERPSAIWTFRTKPFPPSLSSPNNNQQCLTKKVNFTWGSVSGATKYKLQVSTSSDFSTTVYDQDTITQLNASVVVPNYNTVYYWRVRGNEPCETDYSQVRSFSTSKQPPTLVSPNDGASFVALRAGLSWSISDNPEGFALQVALDSLFTTIISDQYTTNTFDSVNLGSSNTTYWWRVKAIYSDCETEYSNIWKFITLYNGPSLKHPANDTSCAPLNLNLVWDAVEGASAYRVRVSENEDMSSPIINKHPVNATNTLVTLPKGLTKYYWTVRAEDNNNTGAWSDTLSFTTNVEIAQKLYPPNGTEKLPVSITLKWQKLAQGTNYLIQVAKDPDFKNPEIDKRIQDADTLNIKLKQFFATYYWRISTQYLTCKNPWSDVWTFNTVILPPNLTYPVNNSSKLPTNITFTWEKPEGATSYNFQLSTDPNFGTLVHGRNGLPLNEINVQADKLTPSSTFYWRVSAANAEGTSDWSQTYKFTTGAKALNQPTLISPKNLSTNLSYDVLLEWSEVETATQYHLQLADNPQFNKPIVNIDNIPTNSYEVIDLKSSTEYFWRVLASNDSSQSFWSEVWRFTTVAEAPSEPVSKLKPEENAIDVPVDLSFTWLPLNRAINYEFQLSTSPNFLIGDLIIHDSTLTATSRYVKGLQNSKTYYWRVLGKNEGGKGPWSDFWKFTTAGINSADDTHNDLFELRINPNPATNRAVIEFYSPETSSLELGIYDIMGRKLNNLAQGFYLSGSNQFEISTDMLESGIYFIEISNKKFTAREKLYIIK
jgi:fibronectin type 3 domain-containing protein